MIEVQLVQTASVAWWVLLGAALVAVPHLVIYLWFAWRTRHWRRQRFARAYRSDHDSQAYGAGNLFRQKNREEW